MALAKNYIYAYTWAYRGKQRGMSFVGWIELVIINCLPNKYFIIIIVPAAAVLHSL